MRHALAAVVFVLPLIVAAFALPPAVSRSFPVRCMCTSEPGSDARRIESLQWPTYGEKPRSASLPSLRPRPASGTTPRTRLAYGLPDSDVDRLRDDVRRLERLVLELCGALVYSDDIALLERTTAGLGPIYRDASFSATRHPVFARKSVEHVLDSKGLVATPPVRVWTPVSKPGKS